MKVTRKKLSELHHPDKNIRKHTAKQTIEYVRSVSMFGQIRPIVVDETGTILAGNGLFEALVYMGAETADCYVMSGLTDKQKTKLMLADNKVYELGTNDMDMLTELVHSLEDDIDVPGYDADLLNTINASLQEVDHLIEDYGHVDHEYAERLNRNAENTRPIEHAQNPPEMAIPAAAMPQPAAGATQPENGINVAHSFIICPKCGERIPCP